MGRFCSETSWVRNLVSPLQTYANIDSLHRFMGAYCSILEHEALPELFGNMNVEAVTLPEMADKIIEMTQSVEATQ